MNDEDQSEENQTVQHMATVKKTLDMAPEGSRKTEALKHYQAAERAHEADNDEEAYNELKKAGRVLS